MKKSIYLFALLFSASFIFTACDRDEPVASVSLNHSTLTLTIGESQRLIATILPVSATNQNVTWTSDNEDVAVVDINGVVTAVAEGTAIITIRTECGGKMAICTVTAEFVAVTDISLNKTSLMLIVNETEKLIATIMPENATNRFVSWGSTNENVATVDNNGVITAMSAGTAIIVAEAVGGRTVSCVIFVYTREQLEDEGIVIDGIRWATRNVDAPGIFALNPESRGMFYQWNRNVGWSSSDLVFNSDGGNTRDWDNSTPIGTNWERENDPCPVGWRVPTSEELLSLYNSGSIWTRQNNVNGRLFGTYPYQIFLPANGSRSYTVAVTGGVSTVHWRNSHGSYWSSTASGAGSAMQLGFWESEWLISVSDRYRVDGRSVRCVAVD